MSADVPFPGLSEELPAAPARLAVALYDDDEITRAGLTALLAAEEIDVVTGGAIEDGGRRPPIGAAAVLVSTGGPDGAGLALARGLARVGGSPPVVLFASHPGELEAAGVVANGACGIVCRRCGPERIAAALRRVAVGGIASECFEHAPEAEPAERPPALSAQERKIVGELARGRSTEEIAEALWVSPHTVRTHVRNIVRKLGARTRAHAVAIALARGEAR